ncbi:MAG: flagellar basal body P-ring formation chaperone FlgA [Nitrospiria bacterium]
MKRFYFSGLVLIFTGFLAVPVAVSAVAEEEVPRRIEARLSAHVAEALSVEVSEIEVDRVRTMSGQNTLRDGKIIKVKAMSRGRILGRVVFLLTMSGGNGGSFEQWVSADVQQLREIVVAKRALRRLDVIGSSDVAYRTIRVRNARHLFETNAEDVIGKRVTQSLRKGAPIRLNQLEETPLVRRGERVTVTLKSGGLQIVTAGEAKEDGHLGEMIKVVNLDSRKMIFAQVRGSGDVRIDLPSKE